MSNLTESLPTVLGIITVSLSDLTLTGPTAVVLVPAGSACTALSVERTFFTAPASVLGASVAASTAAVGEGATLAASGAGAATLVYPLKSAIAF